MATPRRLLTVLLATLAALGCGPDGPRAISYGAEPCAHCHMTISDPRFSAEALTATGQAHVFDDVACLASWLIDAPPEATGWVMSFVDGTTWLPAASATYLRSDSLRTPMASGLAALRPGREADSVAALLGGTLLSWREVRDAARQGAHDHPASR